MQDLDSAVGRLDNILMSLYVVVAALIIAVAMVRESPNCRYFQDLHWAGLGDSITGVGYWRWNSDPWYTLLLRFRC